jgi:ParB/RepB/Spo0J family partition protein
MSAKNRPLASTMVNPNFGNTADLFIEQVNAGRSLAGAYDMPLRKIISRKDALSVRTKSSYDDESISELRADIEERGVLEPILVRPAGDFFEILAGERRFRAIKMTDKQTIPVIVIDADDKKAKLIHLAENIQRKDLTPVEEREFFRVLQSEYNMSNTEIAKRINKSISYVGNRLNLTDDQVKMIETKAIVPMQQRNPTAINGHIVDAESVSEEINELANSVKLLPSAQSYTSQIAEQPQKQIEGKQATNQREDKAERIVPGRQLHLVYFQELPEKIDQVTHVITNYPYHQVFKDGQQLSDLITYLDKAYRSINDLRNLVYGLTSRIPED